MIINDAGQIIAVKITQGNIDDRMSVTEVTKKFKGLYILIKAILDLIFSRTYTKET